MIDTDRMLDVRILLPAALLLLVLSTAVAATRPVSQEMMQYPMEVRITDDLTNISVGISVDDGKIDFGELPARTMHAEKAITVHNNEEQPVTIRAEKTGNISTYIDVEPSAATVSAQSEHEFTVTIRTTNITTPGNYSGMLRIVEEKPVWRWLWTRK